MSIRNVHILLRVWPGGISATVLPVLPRLGVSPNFTMFGLGMLFFALLSLCIGNLAILSVVGSKERRLGLASILAIESGVCFFPQNGLPSPISPLE